MKKNLLCCGFLILGTGMAFANSPWTISLNPGYALPQEDSKDVLKNGLAIDGAGEYRVDEWLSLGLETGASFHKAGGTLNGFSFSSDIHDQFIHVTPYVKVGNTLYLPVVRVRPYLFVGAGYYHVSNSAGSVSILGTSYPVSGSSDDFSGMNVGGGFDILLTDRFSIGPIVHYHQVFEPGSDDKLVIPGLRVAYTFN